jgi:hypothetical protein
MDAVHSLKIKIREAVRAATHTQRHLPWSAEAIARQVIGNNAELVQVWAFERIATFVRAELRARPDPNQLCLPGFKDLSRRLPIEDGFVRLGEATITDLRNVARTIRERDKRAVGARAARLQKLIALMAPFAAKIHGLTVAQFYAMRARGGSAAAPATTPTANQTAASFSV